MLQIHFHVLIAVSHLIDNHVNNIINVSARQKNMKENYIKGTNDKDNDINPNSNLNKGNHRRKQGYQQQILIITQRK